tara:strand:+ start:20986 stop:21537 length:552 start_codon:yes stop_codon:yes gene_type:complete
MKIKMKGQFLEVLFYGLDNYNDFYDGNLGKLIFKNKYILKNTIETKINENDFIKDMDFFENNEYKFSEEDKLKFILSEETFINEKDLKNYSFLNIVINKYNFVSHKIELNNINIESKTINLSRYTDFLLDEDLMYDLVVDNTKVNLDQKRFFIIPPKNKKINTKNILMEYEKESDLYHLDTVI